MLDGTVALSELTGRRVTLSYIPATVDDHQTVNAFGGLSGVPLYLVRVRPHLNINGRPEVVGTGSLEMGVAHRMEVELLGPFGSERVTQTVVSGSYHALGFGVQGLPRQVPEEDDQADTERLAAQLLSQIALSLNEQWSTAEDELAGLLDVAVLRPLPSVVMVSNAVAVDYALDLPSQLRWTGVTMDAALRVAEPMARGNDGAAAHDWMRLSALQGSMLEHRIFENQFLVESISADKGLGLARHDDDDDDVDVLLLDQGEGDPR
ncbi:MAG: hypothetical protein GY856_12080, partial [bacterium]|nr:hypothetical protein [bacterium]